MVVLLRKTPLNFIILCLLTWQFHRFVLCIAGSLSRRSKSARGMDEQKSNCEENDSEPTADDSAPSKQLVSTDESIALLAAEDVSGATSASSSTPVENVRACALCNCVERSLHGQRELRHFGPSSEQLTFKPSASPLPQPGNDDLSSIGFSDLPCLAALFDDSGGCWVHHWCAVWSEGVKRMQNEELENVDKAVISGTQRLCEYCKRLGATIRCHAEGCSRFYHFPCSAASGSFQSMKQLFLLCPEHIDKAEELAREEAWCAVCDSLGELTDLLFCTGCGQHYHAACLEIGATPIQRAGWQCPECKVCQTCRQPGEDSKMLVCDACDKGYHTFCLQPAMDSLPSDPWKCRRCRVCTECGVRGLVLPGSAQWFDNYAVCEACQRQRSSTCGVCSKAANPSVALQCCSMCHRWVHSECALPGELPEAKCICLLCKEQQPVTQPYTAEIQTREASEESEGHVEMVEMTIQTNADIVTKEHTDLSEVPPGQRDASEMGQAEATKETLMELDLGVESTVVEATNVGERIMGEELKVATEELPSEAPAAPLESTECATTEQGPSCLPADEERAEEVVSLVTQVTPSQDPIVEKQSNNPKVETLVSQQIHEHMEVEKEEEKETTPSVEQEAPAKLLSCDSDGMMITEPFRKDPPKLPASPANVEKAELLPMDNEQKSPCQDHQSPSPLSLSVDTQEVISAVDMEGRLLPHSEEEEEEEDDEPMKGEEHNMDIKQELQEQEVKPELLLDEMSNMSHGDESSSGFMGSPGEPDPQLSMELGLVPVGRSHTDNLLTETDDSLPFEPLRSDREKVKRRGSPGRSRVKQGRGSSFAGKRRPRGGGGGRGRGGRSRLKAMASCIDAFLLSMTSDTGITKEEDDEEDDTMQNTVVLFSNTDKFVLLQDMCVVCGSFGKGAEGQLLACAQCAQCYHPYCVNSKITKTMLRKGWRCLECIVCEVCGKASDPSRLLLCDDCDVSYHTYCLDPPLHNVPKGGWKCKWCVCCVQCGSNSPGFHCEWQNNYTHCGPCASLVTCPVCRENFMEEELLLQCQYCDRWVHAVCESLYTEDEVEQASDEGFACTSCTPYVPKPVVESAIMASIKIKEPEPQFYRLEGVWLTESGMSLLRSISMSPLHKRRQRRSRLGTLCGEVGPDGMDLREADGDGEEGKGEPMECESKMENLGSPDREGEKDAGAEGAEGIADCEGLKGGAEETEDSKKRKRKPYRPGIGGFMVRQRKCHTRLKKEFFAQLAGETMLDGQPIERTIDEGPHPDTDNIMDPKPVEGEEQAKKRRGRRKSKLEDMFPSYLQEAFFGKNLIDLSKKAVMIPPGQRPGAGLVRPSLPAPPGLKTTALETDAKDFVVKDSFPLKQEGGEVPQAQGEGAGVPAPASLLTDQASTDPHDSDAEKSEGLPQGVESQDSEQFFRKVLGVSDGSSLGGMKPILEGSKGELSRSALPQRSLISGSLPSAGMMDAFPGLSQSPFFDMRDRGGLFSPEGGEESPWATPSTPATPSSPPTPTEGEGDGLSYNQRSLQRWEKDEELGELSTISPVLYANTNFPSLKQDYPDWASRCKQIMKIWRKVSAADKVPYLQKAKDNRAAQRINKAQKQAESQVCRPIKTESGRVKGERPSLHLQIPPPSGSTSISSQPSSAESPFPFPPDSGSSSVFFSDGPVKTPGSAEIRTDPLTKFPPQSPHSHSHPTTPFSHAGASPLQASSSGYSASGPQGPPQGRPASLGPFDMQPGTPGTPRRAQQVDPYFRSQLQQQQGHLPQSQQGSQESLGPPESPHSRSAGLGDSPMFSPPHNTHYGEPLRNPQGTGRLDYGSSPSPSAVVSSPASTGLYRPDMSAPSPRSSTTGRLDISSGSPAGMLESGDGLFKAPMTPRIHQGEGGVLQPGASPSHPSEGYRQSPSHTFSDPNTQPPLTPRPQSGDNCSLGPQRHTVGQQELCSRVPSSPQSQGSSQSPHTPGGLSNDAYTVQSPAAPRFQSPDPCSQPPSRPQSRDPFATIHKPPQPPSVVSEGTASYKSSPHANQPPPPHSTSSSIGDPLSGKPSAPPTFSRSPSTGSYQITQQQSQMLQGQLQQPQPQAQQTMGTDSFSSRVPPPSGSQELPAVRPPDAPHQPALTGTQEMTDISAVQDPALVGLSPSDLEKHRQRQRLREFLIRQQMQRNSIKQEKEAAAATAGSASPGWSGGEMGAFQDKAHRAPPPYPQDRAASAAGAQASVAGKMPMAVGDMDEKLIHPPPTGTPAIMDPSALRPPGPTRPQGMFGRPPFPPQWQGQAPGPRRFPQPPMETMGMRHNLNPAVSIQGMEGMGNPHTMIPGPGGETMQPVGQGPPPQFIELRHNSQRLPLRPQFMPRGPQPRPRLFVPQQEMTAPYVQQHPIAQAGGVQTDRGSNSQLGLQQGGLSVLMPPQSTGPVTQQPHLQPEIPTSTPNIVSTEQHQVPQQSITGPQPTTVVTSEELPEPDLEGLGDPPGDGGVEDEDDLALDLDPDKGDDDLGNLDNLETNDPHLDDLLNSDEFDLLAYTDPELDQGDPKDVFSDQLRLVEAESEAPSSSSGSVHVKVEEKTKVEPGHKALTTASASAGGSATHLPPSAETVDTSRVKVEDRSLMPQLQPEQVVVKDEIGEAVSMLLGGNAPSAKPAQPENQSASLSSVRLGGLQYPLPSQADSLTFPPAAPHADIGDDPLELPDVGEQHSPAVDLAKVESSLDGELPLLIQDLLEHEKKEQQKQQQLSSLHQGGMAPHFPGLSSQQPNPQAPGHIMLPHHHRPPQGMMAQPGMVPRAPHMLQQQQQQQQQQQRLMGTGMAPPPHIALAQQQVMMRMGQPGIHTGVSHQQQPQAVVKQSPLTNNFFPEKDLDKFAADDIMDPIAKAKMVALKGIKRVLAQDPMVVPPGINRQQVSLLAQRLASAPGTESSQLTSGPQKEGETSDPTQSRPNPPQFVQGIINDAEQHQYEEWLLHTQQLLQMQLKFLEEQIGVHRKSRKALCAKQRTAKKAGREFAEADAEKLKLVTEEQSKIQKQLDQVRKQQKEHTNLIAEYRSKQQQHQQGSGLLTPGHSAQGGPPHMFSKMPGQMVMGQQGAPVMGQHPGMIPQGGMPVRMPQGQPFHGGAQPQLPATLGASGPRAPGPPGTPTGFFPQGPGMQSADPRLLQERQLQHRMQMAKLQQQPMMMGQQPMPHPSNQQSGLIAQPQSGMIGNPLMAQQQANPQQVMLSNQSNQQNMVQVSQGMVGGQSAAPPPQNLAGGQPINHPQMMAGQPVIMASQPVALSQQRPQLMTGQQGMVGSPGHPGLRGPQVQLTPQQQNMLAQRMLASQQQNVAKNLAHLQQQQMTQQRQPTQLISQSSQEQGGLSQPTTPQMGSSPSAGSITPQPQGATDSQTSGPKEGGILSPDSRTPPQQSGPSTPNQVTQLGSANGHQIELGRQQLEQQQQHQQQNQVYMAQQQQSNPQSVPEQQTGLIGNEQSSVHQQKQQQLPLTLQRQSTLSTDKPSLITVKEEGKPIEFLAPQQQQQTVQNAMQQSQDPSMQQQFVGQNHPGQPQPVMMGHNPQQQALMVQQQKQQAMMSMIRAQQQGMMAQRPVLSPGQIRTPINIQAIIAQNPQLRNLPPNQQIQHIQAMIAQRQGQMLRMSMGQGQQSQLRPHMPTGQVSQVVQQIPVMEGQQMPCGAMEKPGAVSAQPQPGMLGQQPSGAPQIQHMMMVPGQQQPQVGEMMQHVTRGHAPVPPSHVDHGRIVRPASPRQPVANSPGDPQRHAFNQTLGMRPPTPNQNQQALMVATAGRMQGSPSHAYSPRGPFGMSPAHPASPHSSHVSSPSIGDSRAGRGSPYSQVKASPLRSPGAKSPLDSSGLKVETQTSGSETSQTTLVIPNGPQKGMNVLQQSQQVTESHVPHAQHGSRVGELSKITLRNIKQEPGEVQCDGAAEAHPGAVKRETTGDAVSSGNNTCFAGNMAGDPGTQGTRPETGQQLLQKLLRTKNLQLGAQRPSEGIHNEINGHINTKLAMLEQKLQGTPRNMEDLQSITKRAPVQKPKRTNKAAGDRGPNARKKNKKEEVGKSAEALIKQLKQGLSLLPLMEPSITASLDLFAPFGSSPVNGKAQLKGSFGNAVLDNIPDYYSQLLTKSNLSNPPTPPSSLPPTPPPSVQHKLLNGVTPGEELSEVQKDTEPAEEPMDAIKEEVRSVDILAALPTPPHNQNEDIRMESDEEDAPESIIPASSPESNVGEETSRFPHLREPKDEETERAISPIIPLIPRTAIPAFPENKPLEANDNKVDSTSNHWDKPKSNEVSVTLTLSSAAAKKLNHVMMAMTQLLNIRMPGSYEVTFPPQNPDVSGADGPGKGPGQSGALCTKDGASPSQDEWLRQFDVSLPGCTLKKQVDILALIKQEFPEKEDKPVQHCYTTNVNDLDVRHLPHMPVEESPPPSPSPPQPPPSVLVPSSEAEPSKKSASPSPSPSSPTNVQMNTEPEQDVGPPIDAAEPTDVRESEVVAPESVTDSATVCAVPEPAEDHLSPASKEEDSTAGQVQPPEDSSNNIESSPKAVKQRRPLSPDEEVLHPKVKKWKGIRWKRLQIVISIRKGGSKKESSREVSELMERLRITLRPDRLPRDKRKCCFCHEEGDGATDGPARLLNIDVDLWVHLNCALWSTEVYETQGGALINVEVALRRGLRTLCAYCQKTGATNSCNRLRCPNVYHFACAIRARCMFFKDKTMLCTQHKLKGPSEDELSAFAVLRRVYIERDEVKQIASILQRGDRVHLFRVGGLIFHAVGQLLPSQMANFHSPTAIFPVGYEATRIYWSMRLPNKRCRYRCRISEDEGRPLFEVRVLEHGMEDLHFRDSTPEGIWEQIVQQVAKLRDESSMLKLFTEHVKGEEMYGLTVHAVMRITESLPGVENCQNYQFRYGRHPLMELPLMINPTGCARSEPKVSTQCKRPHTLNSTSVSKAYQSTFTGELNTPYSKQFVHSKSSQYRRLKTEWKNNVYLARSRIQGLGLYAAKDLEKHTMVIEYIGTVIRNEVANRREKIYESQNRGIYMFRINNEQVIDATLTGGPARYVNHSCAPNCVAEVVTFDKEDKIIIISSRRIPKGEELTYDYQFDFEDDQHKIPCHCGAWNCRKWMN
uniref:histone-lysine N-methyltransferase 2D isoform X2 n=1 Tax=Scatophagus argus TaxID=75038 RepID=UPI001ED80540|nr:histone-lysine N-methyltransferase 2D isoform X2 [Scatophagus argus]